MAASTALESVFDGESFSMSTTARGEERTRIAFCLTTPDNVVLQIRGTLMKGKEALRGQFMRPFITAFPANRHL